jgi:outer membrane lipoprotein carrier protein
MAEVFLHFILLATLTSAHDPNSIRRAVEARYRHAGTLRAVFYERYSDGNGAISAESGTVYFSRPGRMRWEYESPESKLFLVDGKNVWFYVPADHTASRSKLSESSDWRTPLALLAGNADLSKLCRSIEVLDPALEGDRGSKEPPRASGDTVLRCIPREGSASDTLREVLFEADPQAYLVRVLIREAGGVETEFRFENWEEDLSIPEAQFHFQPPPGVAVVDEQALTDTIR